MSFSADVKNELAEIRPQKGCCLAAQCYGMLEFAHAYCGSEVSLQTEHGGVAAVYSALLKECCLIPAPAVQVKKRRGDFFCVAVEEPWARARTLERYGHTAKDNAVRMNRANIDCDGCGAALLRGAFLVCGAVSNPENAYHLESSFGSLLNRSSRSMKYPPIYKAVYLLPVFSKADPMQGSS